MIKEYKPQQWQNFSTSIKAESFEKLDGKICTKWEYDSIEKRYIFTLADGTKRYAEMSELIDTYDSLILDYSDTEYSEPEKIHYLNITNCKNCGAPLKSGKCEYCGSQYYIRGE